MTKKQLLFGSGASEAEWKRWRLTGMVKLLDNEKNDAGRVCEFSVTAKPGLKVFVAGSFNDWDPEAAPMSEPAGDGHYICRITLAPGSYEYKFVLDDLWILDDENPNFASNDFGTLNSVLVVN